MSISLASSTGSLGDLICVRAPYNALRNIEANSSDEVRCELSIEHLVHGEATQISGAEAGRHLAILGSYALAHANPVKTKHFYLANEAFIIRKIEASSLLNASGMRSLELTASARVTEFGKRRGKVTAVLNAPQLGPIFEIEVVYNILRAEIFERLFKQSWRPATAAPTTNPYASTPNLIELSRTPDELTASLGVVEPAQCAGHFENYPALPIAILSGSLANLAATHLKALHPAPGLVYAINWCKVAANRLAFAGERIELCSRVLHHGSREVIFRSTAYNESREAVGEIEINYEILAERADHGEAAATSIAS